MPSSVVKSYEYFPEKRALRIFYISGAVYDYLDVPQIVFDEFRGALSKGTFLNRHIKTRYRFRKIL